MPHCKNNERLTHSWACSIRKRTCKCVHHCRTHNYRDPSWACTRWGSLLPPGCRRCAPEICRTPSVPQTHVGRSWRSAFCTYSDRCVRRSHRWVAPLANTIPDKCASSGSACDSFAPGGREDEINTVGLTNYLVAVLTRRRYAPLPVRMSATSSDTLNCKRCRPRHKQVHLEGHCKEQKQNPITLQKWKKRFHLPSFEALQKCKAAYLLQSTGHCSRIAVMFPQDPICANVTALTPTRHACTRNMQLRINGKSCKLVIFDPLKIRLFWLILLI